MNKPCVECGNKRKHMVYDWASSQWFCAKDFKALLKDYRSSKPASKKVRSFHSK